MQSTEDARYRLRLASGFLTEARQDVQLGRWRSCVDNSQLAVENAAKVPLYLLGPLGHTHQPADLLRRYLAEGRIVGIRVAIATRLGELAEELGREVHAASDYGDESARRTPWEIFDGPYARNALDCAEEAVTLAAALVEKD